MASSLISGAVSLILILVAGYVIATGILTISETMIYTQSEMAMIYDSIHQTHISMADPAPEYSGSALAFNVVNNGTTSFEVTDTAFDFFVDNSASKVITRYSKADLGTISITIPDDIINKGFWDPSEILHVSIPLAYTPDWVKIVTPNGISAAGSVTVT